MDVKDFFSLWKEVFRKWKYFLLTLITAFVFYLVSIYLSEISIINNVFKQKGFSSGVYTLVNSFIQFPNFVKIHSLVSLIIIAVLLGLLTSLIAYKTNMIKKTSGKTIGFLGTTGIFLGVLAPGCSACGIGLLSALGIGGAFLTFLPFHGLEISILAILILSFTTFKITYDINKGIVCEIKN
jgi:hypothetical protein|tara:strand:- start:41 stop:586 length:546 start_codon:yes stop_codon:yes gene_type:complete